VCIRGVSVSSTNPQLRWVLTRWRDHELVRHLEHGEHDVRSFVVRRAEAVVQALAQRLDDVEQHAWWVVAGVGVGGLGRSGMLSSMPGGWAREWEWEWVGQGVRVGRKDKAAAALRK
jgi:hypothetical protein